MMLKYPIYHYLIYSEELLMVEYADRMRAMKPSPIRALLALTQKPEVTSFAGGLPAPELFPVDDFRVACDAVLKESGRIAMQYGTTDGFTPLRQQICDRLFVKNQIKTSVGNILLTAGSQQGLDFCARVFVNPGDKVIMEAPSYLGAINAFNPSQPEYIEIPTDEYGMDLDALEKALAGNANIKLIYVIPDFQNPSGRTWPMDRREKFMEIITRYEIPVIEDNPYGELRYKGEFLPALKSMDTKGLVIYLGTFSKILSPGIRLGWMCASEEYISKFNLLAQAAVLQTTTFGAMAVSKYLEMFDVDAHVEECRQLYKHRASVMVQAMKDYFPDCVKFTDPDGGLFTWVECPDYMDTNKMAEDVLKYNVAFVPGDGFFPNGENHHCFRLNYSCASDEQIINGIKVIADVIRSYIK